MALSDLPPYLEDSAPASSFAAYTRSMAGSGAWTTIATASGVTANPLRFCIVAGLVIVQLRLVAVPAGGANVVGTLPASARPASEVSFGPWDLSTPNQTANAWINSAGSITIQGAAGKSWISQNIIFPRF